MYSLRMCLPIFRVTQPQKKTVWPYISILCTNTSNYTFFVGEFIHQMRAKKNANWTKTSAWLHFWDLSSSYYSMYIVTTIEGALLLQNMSIKMYNSLFTVLVSLETDFHDWSSRKWRHRFGLTPSVTVATLICPQTRFIRLIFALHYSRLRSIPLIR